MNKKEYKKHYNNLLLELEDVKIKERNSDYLIDYLYGVSDVKNKIEEYLFENKNNEWVLFYRLLVQKKALKKEIENIRKQKDLYFVMEDENDLEAFYKHLETLDLSIEQKVDALLKKYKEDKINEKYKNILRPLLLKFYELKDYKENPAYAKSLHYFGEKFKSLNSKKEIMVTFSEFMTEEFGFKKNDYSRLTKSYKEK